MSPGRACLWRGEGGRKWEAAGGINADYTVKLKPEILS